MLLGLFGGANQLNAIFGCVRNGDFRGRMQTIPHGLECHGGVPFPRSANQSEVCNFRPHGCFPGQLFACKNLGNTRLKSTDLFQCLIHLGAIDIGDCGDFGVALLNEPLQHVNQTLPAIAQSEQSNSNFWEGFRLQIKGTAVNPGSLDFVGDVVWKIFGVPRCFGKGTE